MPECRPYSDEGETRMTGQANGDPWEVFDYERDMFFGLCEVLADKDHYDAFPRRVRNAITESTLLHARQLVDLLLSRGKDQSDINIGMLLPRFDSPQLEALRLFYGDRNTPGCPCWTINKRLAHVTTHRGTSHDYTDLLRQLQSMLSNIVREVLERRYAALTSGQS
jgi:hypothetical protein